MFIIIFMISQKTFRLYLHVNHTQAKIFLFINIFYKKLQNNQRC